MVEYRLGSDGVQSLCFVLLLFGGLSPTPTPNYSREVGEVNTKSEERDDGSTNFFAALGCWIGAFSSYHIQWYTILPNPAYFPVCALLLVPNREFDLAVVSDSYAAISRADG